MGSYRIEGEATALSSISHGGEHAGTTGYLRREKIVQPDGAVVEVPVVSGNSLRGVLRDVSADATWQMLGRPQLSVPVFDALWSGGSLAKAGTGGTLDARQLSELRRLCPHVALFGCAGGGRIIEGRLRVGKLVPVCAETAHLIPEGVDTSATSIWSMLQIEEFSRMDDAKRPSLAPVFAGQLETADSGDGGDVVTVERDNPQQMRYGVETIVAGTRFHWWMMLEAADDLVAAQLRVALNGWAGSGAHVGGRSSTGHGRLRLDLSGWVATSHSATVGAELAESWHRSLSDHHDHNRDAIIEALSWLT